MGAGAWRDHPARRALSGKARRAVAPCCIEFAQYAKPSRLGTFPRPRSTGPRDAAKAATERTKRPRARCGIPRLCSLLSLCGVRIDAKCGGGAHGIGRRHVDEVVRLLVHSALSGLSPRRPLRISPPWASRVRGATPARPGRRVRGAGCGMAGAGCGVSQSRPMIHTAASGPHLQSYAARMRVGRSETASRSPS